MVDDLEIDDAVEIVIDPGGDSDSDLLTFSTMQKNKVDIGKYTKVLGNIIAPKAEVHFSDESQFRGTVCAEKVTVEEGVPFLHHNSPQSLPKRVVPDYVDDDDAIAEVVPTVYDLSQNYPNPFNPTTVIRYQLPASAEVKLSIYNTAGQLVRTLVNGEMPAGTHSIVWDATDNSGQRVASGVYLYLLRAGEFTSQKKLILMK
ncbi:MAG: T9SS type A sorting domain-containing protein [Deferribacteres bacterium]|nr:T9SS type A sorting domain-containing protein [Deferribacteres bacterium]